MISTKPFFFNPKFPDAYYHRGLVKYKLIDYREAVRDFNKTIKLFSRNAKAYMFRGLSKIKLGDKANGCSDLSKAMELGDKEAPFQIKKYCE